MKATIGLFYHPLLELILAGPRLLTKDKTVEQRNP